METSINEAVGYGPVFRWCSDCAISRDVSETTHKCPICRVIFSEVAEQHERNKEAEKRSGGKASYSYKYDGYGNTIETAIYDNNEKLTNLYMGCPASNCRNITSSHYYHSSGLNASNHSGCGSLLISNKGNINCSSCGTSSTVRNWKFNCSYHSEYRTTSSISFLRSLTVAADLSSESGMLKELRNYLINNN